METIETTIRPLSGTHIDQEVVIIGERVIPNQQIMDSKKSNMFQTERTYVQILNEMFPNQTSYVEEGSTGPQHNPLFRIGVHVRGLTFHGVSRTKQKARHSAAKAAINYFRSGQQPHYSPHAVPHLNRYDNYHRYQPYYRLNRYDNYNYNRWERAPTPTQLHSFDYSRYEPYFSFNYDYNYDEFNESQTHSENNYLKFDPNSDEKRESHNFYERQRPTLLYNYQRDAINLGPNLEKPSVADNCSPSSSRVLTTGGASKTNRNDFTADEYNSDGFLEFNQTIDNKEDDSNAEPNEQIIKTPNKQRIILRVMSETPVNQNPVSLIHELQPNAKWVCTELNTKKHSTTFEMRLLLPLADQCFTGIAKTKKLAKVEAASKALLLLYNITLNCQNSDNPESVYKPQSTVQIAQEPLILKQDTANRIGAAVMAKCTDIYDQLTDLKKWTVLSGIVLTDETNVDFIDVICLTTGTKCVKGDSLSMNGYALNDCHAEVLSRRALIHYIYRQIERLIDNNFEDKSEFIVERRTDGFGFRIKTNIRVNLFISTAPCGDSRVFSPKEEESDAHPNRQTRGLLRAKIEGGEGTIPVKRDSIQTWDGILQGHQRLQFMSCSDKIALWNVVGIQGALLSHLIEPIYLSSVVLASLFNYEHLVRALHGRLNLNFDSNSLKGMPQQFVLNKCKVAKCQLKDDITRQLTKAPNYALNWIKGDQNLEVVSTESGRIHTENTISRLAKRSLFGRFCALLGRNSPVLPTCSLGQNIPLIYRDGKTASLEYQRAKTQCMQTFQEQNLGNWIQVPSEIDLFRF